jgi:hypothetical protein
MEKLNITQCEWRLSKQHFLHIENESGEWVCQLNDIKPNETPFLSDEYLLEEQRVKSVKEHNAILIADAGTTYNTTPILPSELLKQRNELLAALFELRNAVFFPENNIRLLAASQSAKDLINKINATNA